MAHSSKREIGELAKEAFNKLSSYIYFDKQNLLIRECLAEFILTGGQDRLEDFDRMVDSYDQKIKDLINRVDLAFLPKSVKENSNLIPTKYLSNRFYTNQVYKDSSLVDRISIFIEAPLEIHLISVMWLVRYGKYFDEVLVDECRGNRLEHNNKKLKGRLLFKKYEFEYQRWWSDGIATAEDLFKKKEDVTILNFDFKDYYHSIELNLENLTRVISENELSPEVSNLHLIFLDIHTKYRDLLLNSGYNRINASTNLVPLPIGLLSSGVLANWYLSDFDQKILENKSIAYYGRYVDDLMIVVRNSIVEEFNDKNVQDIIADRVEFKSDHNYIIYYWINKYLSSIFKLTKKENESEPLYCVNDSRYTNLVLQSEKFSIFQFNVDFSPQLLNKFIEEQQEKSSVFQFLSEDDDNVYKELDRIVSESSFDGQDLDSVGLKHIDDNKFKLSVYLSKLARGSVVSGASYDQQEAEKVKKHFRGFYLLRNYFFWEKLLSIWVARSDYETLVEMANGIVHQIDSLELDKTCASKLNLDFQYLDQNLRTSLRRYFDVAIKMSIGLDLQALDSVEKLAELKLPHANGFDLYRRVFLLRKNFIAYPLLQFTESVSRGKHTLFAKTLVDDLIGDPREDLSLATSFYPYRVKLNECCQFAFVRSLKKVRQMGKNEGDSVGELFSTEALLNDAFEIFCFANQVPGDEKSEVRDEYFVFSELNKSLKLSEQIDTQIKPLKISNGGRRRNGTLRVCVVNKFVDARESNDSMLGKPKSDNSRYEDFNKIFDDIRKIKDPDLAIMPEICLPYHFIPQATVFAASNQISIVSGVEHFKVGEFAFNFVLSVFPMKVFDDRDSVVIPRLKNHYAPGEKIEISKAKLEVPRVKPYRYDLVLWRDTYFSVYYCFELADAKHRHLMLGLVDVLFAPVWNMDVHYYNSLVESASRDLHCFMVLVNTTQFGDSRITRPSNHDRRDKLRVKGGTVGEHKAIVMVSDLEIDNLRNFQITTEPKFNDDISINIDVNVKPLFKPLPPDFPVNAAKLRSELELFDCDDFSFMPFGF